MADNVQSRQAVSRFLREVAGGMRGVGEAVEADVNGHLGQAVQHLSKHAAHEVVARVTERDPHPDSLVARETAATHAAMAAVKFVFGKGMQLAADVADASARALDGGNEGSAPNQIPQLPAPTEE